MLLFFFSPPGYGHIAPATTTGRWITIIYSVIGIPIFLIVLADFGKLFTRCIKFVWAYVRGLYYTGSCRKVRKTVPMQVKEEELLVLRFNRSAADAINCALSRNGNLDIHSEVFNHLVLF